jgi:uncharacterized protein YraI
MKRTILFVIACIGLLSACAPTPTTRYITATPSQIRKSANFVISTSTSELTYTGCVIPTSLRVRDNPSTQSGIVGGLAQNDCVAVKGRNQDSSWAWILSDSLTGWVSQEYLNVDGNIGELPIVSGDNIEIPEDNINVVSRLKPTKLPSPTPTPRKTNALLPDPTVTQQLTNTLQPTNTLHPTNTLQPTNTPATNIRVANIISTLTELISPTRTPRPTKTPESSVLLCQDTNTIIGRRVICTLPQAFCPIQSITSETTTFCYDARYPNHNFTLAMWGSDWSTYNGQCIIVTGLVTLYKGKPHIEANSLSQIFSCP